MQSELLSWQSYWRDPSRRRSFLISLGLLALTGFGFSQFLAWHETRPGYGWDDPVLALITPRDVSMWTFLATYGSLLLGLLLKARSPQLILDFGRGYLMILLMRMIMLLCIPLTAPPGIIPLDDPVLDNLVYEGANLRDLFFSGHVATVSLLAFSFVKRSRKLLFFILAGVVGTLILLQHVHFSIDVFAAPGFAWLVYYVQQRWWKA